MKRSHETIILKSRELKAVSIGLGLSALYLILAIIITTCLKGQAGYRPIESRYLRKAAGVVDAFHARNTDRKQ